jgi:membrane protein DedA with SNARE-associated domain
MPFWAAVLAATLGNLVGSFIAYGFGRASAHRTYGPRATAALAKCDRRFARHGSRAVFIARLLPPARTFISLPAGHSRVGVWPFAVMTVVGCAIWAAAFSLLGFLVGTGWAGVSNTLGALLLALTALAAATWLLPENAIRGAQTMRLAHELAHGRFLRFG